MFSCGESFKLPQPQETGQVADCSLPCDKTEPLPGSYGPSTSSAQNSSECIRKKRKLEDSLGIMADALKVSCLTSAQISKCSGRTGGTLIQQSRQYWSTLEHTSLIQRVWTTCCDAASAVSRLMLVVVTNDEQPYSPNFMFLLLFHKCSDIDTCGPGRLRSPPLGMAFGS